MDKYIAKNITILKDVVVATGEPFLAVSADIYEGEELIMTRKYGFAFGMSKEDIAAEIKKSLVTLRLEREQAEQNKERDALEKKADEAIEGLTGLEISESANQ